MPLTLCSRTFFAASIIDGSHRLFRKYCVIKWWGLQSCWLLGFSICGRPVLPSFLPISDVIFLANFMCFQKNKKKKKIQSSGIWSYFLKVKFIMVCTICIVQLISFNSDCNYILWPDHMQEIQLYILDFSSWSQLLTESVFCTYSYVWGERKRLVQAVFCFSDWFTWEHTWPWICVGDTPWALRYQGLLQLLECLAFDAAPGSEPAPSIVISLFYSARLLI